MSPGQLVQLFEIALGQPDPDVPRLAPSSLSARARWVDARDAPCELAALRDPLSGREIVGPAGQGIDVLQPLSGRLELLGLPRRIGLQRMARDRIRIVLRILVPGLALEGVRAGVIAGVSIVIAGAITLT